MVTRTWFSKPGSISDALLRIKDNLSYFRRNYVIIMLVLIGLSLLWRPVSLIVLIILTAVWIYLYFSRSGPLMLFNRPIGENIIMVVMIVITIVALAFTPDAGTPLLVSVLIALAAILLHAAFLLPDDSDQQNYSSLLGKKSGGV
ncbi:hypothetical protein KP509_29G080600 [Ceratopteris richardii]|nr:hypothetical protein KP509_29G080600 [Ceratopteris richardii]